MSRYFTIAAAIFIIALCAGCTKKTGDSKQQAEQRTVSPHAQSAIAGIHWTVPQQWAVESERPMRVATYSVPSGVENVESGECGVFFFGTGQGGSVDDNLNRWISQFEGGGKHQFSKKEIDGLKVTFIQISGTYLAPAGPMMQSQEKKQNYALLGAIIEAPQGLVFFKYTGPAQSVTASESDFNQLVNSAAKDPAM